MKKKYEKTNKQYQKAIKTIPLATQTTSKSAANFVKGAYPLFLEKGKGGEVWDIDGNKYVDYILGLLPIVLGYQDNEVDKAIKNQLKKGISFSLATTLETTLSELLTKLIPSAEMVRFAKTGSDVTTASIRLARAYTGRDKIALCGYHGWHDWCIGTTEHSIGIPKSIKRLSTAFAFNNLDELEKMLKKEPTSYAAVIIEPESKEKLEKKFLEGARRLTKKFGTLLIFDEIVTGFRVNIGGAQAKYRVTPDLSCFGKSMGNGMPISALVGKAKIMKLVGKAFFSGTFNGEALSLAAAIATIKKLRKKNGIERIQRVGCSLKKSIKKIIDRNKIDDYITIGGPDWRPCIIIKKNKLESRIVQSLLRQQLAKNGLLFGSAFNLCLSHDSKEILHKTNKIWEKTADELNKIFHSKNPKSFLQGVPMTPIFTQR